MISSFVHYEFQIALGPCACNLPLPVKGDLQQASEKDVLWVPSWRPFNEPSEFG